MKSAFSSNKLKRNTMGRIKNEQSRETQATLVTQVTEQNENKQNKNHNYTEN
jgi:hypothetical protein